MRLTRAPTNCLTTLQPVQSAVKTSRTGSCVRTGYCTRRSQDCVIPDIVVAAGQTKLRTGSFFVSAQPSQHLPTHPPPLHTRPGYVSLLRRPMYGSRLCSPSWCRAMVHLLVSCQGASSLRCDASPWCSLTRAAWCLVLQFRSLEVSDLVVANTALGGRCMHARSLARCPMGALPLVCLLLVALPHAPRSRRPAQMVTCVVWLMLQGEHLRMSYGAGTTPRRRAVAAIRAFACTSLLSPLPGWGYTL